MADNEIATLRRVYSALQTWDIDELQRNLTHDIEWVLPETLPWGGAHHGHAGIASFADVVEEHVGGIWADPDDFLSADDRIVVVGRMIGEARATGREFEVPFAHVWALTDGVPSQMRGYYDTAPITAALAGEDPAD